MSTVEICNQALTRYCGERRITALSEERPEAEACAIHYPDALRSMLERHPWTFARSRRLLAQVTNDRPEWRFAYTRPTNALRILWVNDPQAARIAMVGHRSPDTTRETTASTIYSDTPKAAAEFIAHVKDAALFPQSFRDALAAEVATRIVLTLTESGSRLEAAQKAAQTYLDLARVEDMRNEPPVEVNQTPDFLSVRGL